MDMDRDNFDKWIDQWEKAQEDGVFKDSTFKSPASPSPDDIIDDVLAPDNPELLKDWNSKHYDSKYWETVKVHAGLKTEGQRDDGDVKSTMSVEEPDGKTSAQITDKLGGNAHPIQTRSRGVDNRSHITPNFTDGVELVQIHNMKIELEKLESKMNAADAIADPGEAKKVQGKIDDLWKQIDELSNYLNPDFVRDYMS